MKKKLFENVGGNKFRLITESITETVKGADLVREGLKKVFSAGGTQISYCRLENVGLGYIKDVSEATKIALQESRVLARKYGYIDEESSQSFIKEANWAGLGDEYERFETKPAVEPHPEANMANPEEKREVQIANQILDVLDELDGERDLNKYYMGLREIADLAIEIKRIHGQTHIGKHQTPPA